MGSPIFYTAIDESSADTGTYVTGADDGAGNELIVGLDNNITDPGVTTGHKLITRWKTDEGGTSGGTLVVTLLESSTTRMQVSIDTTNEGMPEPDSQTRSFDYLSEKQKKIYSSLYNVHSP